MKRTIGVYVIRCKTTNNRYVGGSLRSIENRFSHHTACLNDRKHHNRFLQKEWDDYGCDEFTFKITKVCCKEDVAAEEQRQLDYWKSRNLCYNIAPKAYSNKGVKWSEESKINCAVKAIARCTPEWREAVSERVKQQHEKGMFGAKTWSEDSRRRVSEASTGRPCAFKGGHHTEEAKRKISARHKGVPKSPEHIAKLSGENHWAYGKPSHRKGTKVTNPESKIRFREAALAREAKKREQRGAA